eukprot:1161292-Pelagomonas_calceolata.AAC.6
MLLTCRCSAGIAGSSAFGGVRAHSMPCCRHKHPCKSVCMHVTKKLSLTLKPSMVSLQKFLFPYSSVHGYPRTEGARFSLSMHARAKRFQL